MRRARVSSEYLGRRGRKRCSNELERVGFGSSKPRIIAPLMSPNYRYGSMSLTGTPYTATATSAAAAAAAARVMTRRMVREMSMVRGYLEVKEEEPAVQAPEEVMVKVEKEQALVTVKEEPEDEEEINTAVAAAEKEEVTDESEGGGGIANVAVEAFDDESIIDWNAWSFDQEDRAWWGSWYWDWIWHPYSDTIHNGINWASYSVDSNKVAEWEVDIWNWD